MRSEIVKKYSAYTKQELIDILVHFSAMEEPSADTPSMVFERIVKKFSPRALSSNEHFVVVTLDGALHIIDIHIISKGIVNRTIAHPREVFKPALLDNATAIIIAHNHPSGSLDPSREDMELTARLKEAGELLCIRVCDHVIFSSSNYRSMQELEVF
jgi:DNA repair protein RadC